MAEASRCPFSLAVVCCCSLRTLFRWTARLCCCSAEQRDTYLSPESALIKCFFWRSVNMPGPLQLPSGLASTCRLRLWQSVPCSPTPGRLLAHGQLGSAPEETCSRSGCTESGGLLLTPPLGNTALKSLQSSPEHAQVTCRKDLDYNSSAACSAQAFWPWANAVDFAYWTIFSSPRGLSYETVVQKLICAVMAIVLLLLPCSYGYSQYFTGNHEATLLLWARL